MQANAKATDYMQAIKDDNNDSMISLSGEGRSDFTKTASDGLKSANYKRRETIKKEPGYVVNFDVTGSDSIHDTSVVISSGKVVSFLINAGGSSTSSNSQPKTSPAPANTCLVVPDLKNAGITYIDEAALQPNARVFFLDLFFGPDSTNFLSDSVASSELSKAANLYNKTNSKDYMFEVEGKVHESTSSNAGVILANDRANKIKSELEKLGIPSSKITVIEVKSGVNSTDSTGSSDRSITVYLKMPGSCDSATPTNGGL